MCSDVNSLKSFVASSEIARLICLAGECCSFYTAQQRGRYGVVDANITKQALAASLRELMEKVVFDKINSSTPTA